MTELETIEEGIKEAKKTISKAEALARLKKNYDFQDIINSGYLVLHAADMVQTKAAYHTQDEKSQRYLDNQIAGIGALAQYMNDLTVEGSNAVDALDSHERERDLLINEEGM